MIKQLMNSFVSRVVFSLVSFHLTYNQAEASHHDCRPGDSCNQLHLAALKGDHNEVCRLLQDWAWQRQIDKTNSGRYTPIDLAIQNGHMAIVQTLLNAGASVNHAINIHTHTSTLDMTLRQDNQDIIKLILPRVNSTNLERTLFRAVESRYYARYTFINTVLENSNNLDLKKRTLLLAKILDNKPYSSASQSSTEKNNYYQAIDKLIHLGIDINYRDESNGNSLLHKVVQTENAAIMNQLFKLGININLRNNNNQTALSIAIDNKLLEMAEALIEQGADVNDTIKRNVVLWYKSEETPLCLAIDKNLPLSFITYLLKKGAQGKYSDVYQALDNVSYSKDTKLVELLVGQGIDISSSNTNDQSLIILALSKNLPLSFIDYLYRHGASINQEDRDENTPLHWVLKQQYGILEPEKISLAKFLVNEGADVNKINKEGKTPLIVAIKNRLPLPFIEDLLKRGADVNQAYKNFITPLHLVLNSKNSSYHNEPSQNDQVALVQLLIDYEADVNALNDDYVSPLLLAIKNRLPLSLIKKLIENDADIDQTDTDCSSPLCLALEQRDEAVARLLLQHNAQVNTATSTGMTPLLLAIKNRLPLSLIKKLIEKDANIDQTDTDCSSPLCLALEQRDEALARLLLQHNAQVNIATSTGMTPLLLALENDMTLSLITELLYSGADINKANKQSLTALHIALERDQFDKANLLIENGADVQAIHITGMTPLHYLCKRENRFSNRNELDDINWTPSIWPSSYKNKLNKIHKRSGANPSKTIKPLSFNYIFKILMDRDAQINAVDHKQLTPLHLALDQSELKLALYLINQGADIDRADHTGRTPLHQTLRQGHFDLAETLIERGANVLAVQKNGETMLHCALKTGPAEALLKVTTNRDSHNLRISISGLLIQLIKRGTPINAVDNNSDTVLHLALKNKYGNAARSFIYKGADVNSRRQNSETPLFLAVKEEENHFLVKTLLEKGADPNHSQETYSAFGYAWQNKYGAIIKLLLEYGAVPDSFRSQLPNSSYQFSRYQSEPELISPLFEAIKAREPRMVRCLLKYGAEIDNTMLPYLLNSKRSPFGSLSLNDIRQAAFMTRQRVNLFTSEQQAFKQEKQNLTQESLSQQNVDTRNFEICELLLRYGANPNQPNAKGDYPLTTAFLSTSQPQTEFIRLLQKAGANPYIASYQGQPLVEELQRRNLLNSVEQEDTVPSLFWLAHAKVLHSFRGNIDNIKTLEKTLTNPSLGDIPDKYFKEFIKKEFIKNDEQTYTDEHYVAQWFEKARQREKTKKQEEYQRNQYAYIKLLAKNTPGSRDYRDRNSDDDDRTWSDF